jgi:hypothetical protein
MAKAVKMMDVVVAGRMAKMRVIVTEPTRESALKITGNVITEAIRQAADAEFNTQPRSKYRKTLIN